MAIPFLSEEPAGPRPRGWSLAVSGIAVVAFIALLALAWMAASTLLLVFAGILLGVFLDGLTRLLGQVLPAGRGLRLSLVSLVLAGLTLGLIAFGGATIVQQGRDLGQTVAAQAGTVRDRLKDYGIDVPDIAPARAAKRERREQVRRRRSEDRVQGLAPRMPTPGRGKDSAAADDDSGRPARSPAASRASPRGR